MAKEFIFQGKSFDEIKKLSLEDFMKLIPSRSRRSLKRGFTEAQKALVKKLQKGKRNIKTHCRDMIIIPAMVGQNILIYNGKEFVPVLIEKEMLGHTLGEFALTRRRVTHNAPGIGATKSSASLSVR